MHGCVNSCQDLFILFLQIFFYPILITPEMHGHGMLTEKNVSSSEFLFVVVVAVVVAVKACVINHILGLRFT